MEFYTEYLISSHKENIVGILVDQNEKKCFCININFVELFEAKPNLGNYLLNDPEESLKNWSQAIVIVEHTLREESEELKVCTIKRNVRCRIYSLPPWPHVCRIGFPGNDDVDKFLQISGTVLRMSAKKLLEYQRSYICPKCKYIVSVEALIEKRNIIKQPKKCPNPERCSGTHLINFMELDPANCKDYQEIKIQEDLSKLNVGSVPNTMIVTLDDDLVDICKPGENVTITGVVKRRWVEFSKGLKMDIDIVFKANHVQVNNRSGKSSSVSDELRNFFRDFWETYKNDSLLGRNIIISSISPELYGLHFIKLAIAVILAGGTRVTSAKSISTGIATRNDAHLLLVGDPGTGKSQMLRFASKIMPRSILTTGVGSTAAGLTVAAVMESGEWHLEAGALVMSDGGICCIDEFNSMKEHDRTSIHEAMEQQTISVAKAGIVTKLNARCSVLAACNPKGNIDPYQPLSVNIAMSSPLLSRFDLILLIKDCVNEENDRKLADFKLNDLTRTIDRQIWNLEKLQAYYTVIKELTPKLTKHAETILSTYYQLQRKMTSRSKSRTTVRLLESLIRLSQGHAKLMFHNEVQILDAVFAIILVDGTLDCQVSLLDLKLSNNSFYESPDTLYNQLVEVILGKLNLDYIVESNCKNVTKDDGAAMKTVESSYFQNESSNPNVTSDTGWKKQYLSSFENIDFKMNKYETSEANHNKQTSKCETNHFIANPSTSKDTEWSRKCTSQLVGSETCFDKIMPSLNKCNDESEYDSLNKHNSASDNRSLKQTNNIKRNVKSKTSNKDRLNAALPNLTNIPSVNDDFLNNVDFFLEEGNIDYGFNRKRKRDNTQKFQNISTFAQNITTNKKVKPKTNLSKYEFIPKENRTNVAEMQKEGNDVVNVNAEQKNHEYKIQKSKDIDHLETQSDPDKLNIKTLPEMDNDNYLVNKLPCSYFKNNSTVVNQENSERTDRSVDMLKKQNKMSSLNMNDLELDNWSQKSALSLNNSIQLSSSKCELQNTKCNVIKKKFNFRTTSSSSSKNKNELYKNINLSDLDLT